MDSAFRFLTAADYVEAYRSGRSTPVQVAERVLEWVSRLDEDSLPLRAFLHQRPEEILQLARESQARYEAGRPLGSLDGVPVAVKDELHQKGYPTTVGTSFLGKSPEAEDATAVARLRAAGALFLGKTNMHEVGLGVTGINPHHGPARNPYDPHRATGGSSSGSAAAVAAGLCPVALGADGGGSIRIPAALCGVVGLKPTHGRVSEHGAFPLCWSVAHVGPLGATTADVLEAYRIVAGPDPKDPTTWDQPKPLVDGLLTGHVDGLRIGICPDFFDQAEESVRKICRQVLEALPGARLVEVRIPNLEYIRPVQYVTIGVEMAAALYEYRREGKDRFAADTRLLLEMASSVPAVDYVRAQRLRTRILRSFLGVFDEVDILASPATARTAPPISDAAAKTGESDEEVLQALTEFSFAANLTGLPAVSVPAGYDSDGLPIGLQFMAAPWREDLLFRAASATERLVERRRPERHVDLLAPET